MIDDQPLKFRGEVYHPYHFNCSTCGVELDANAREVRNRPGLAKNDTNELYCLRCHDKMGVPICGACRRPIEERVVTALGKHWHVEVQPKDKNRVSYIPVYGNFLAFCMCQVREAILRSSPLREKRPGLLRNALSSIIWKSLPSLQSSNRRRWYETLSNS